LKAAPAISKEKAPPFDDGALSSLGGQWQPTLPRKATIVLQKWNHRCNAFYGLPTVRSFPEPKKRDIPGANFARKGFPSARLLQGELRDNAGIEPQ
jgi:hypothetical protein